jgi:hypothetical protein
MVNPQLQLMMLMNGFRPMQYRRLGQRAWKLGFFHPTVNARAFLEERLGGKFEIDLRPGKKPAGVCAPAWEQELVLRERETVEAVGYA